LKNIKYSILKDLKIVFRQAADVYFGRQKQVFNRRKEIKIETIKERRKMNQQSKKTA